MGAALSFCGNFTTALVLVGSDAAWSISVFVDFWKLLRCVEIGSRGLGISRAEDFALLGGCRRLHLRKWQKHREAFRSVGVLEVQRCAVLIILCF